ncbi:MAG: hypothetical protein IJT64_04320 [Kiritimatiellae bacterium]|nr:hypothetical protein [Kiritimatiellia bacterium]
MVFLSGPRQVGKTTLARHFATDYLNWEEKQTRLLVLKGAKAVGNELAHFQTETGATHAFQVVLDAEYEGRDCFASTDPVVVPAKTFLSQLV